MSASLMRLLGYYLAEGWVGNDKSVRFAFNAEEDEYHEDVVRCFHEVFGEDNQCVIRQNSSEGGVVVICNGTIAAKFFSNVGVGAAKKRLPAWAWEASNALLKEFLAGVLAGDGWIEQRTGRIGFSSVSEQLQEDVRRALLRFGIVASVRVRDRKETAYGEARPAHNIVVRGVHAGTLADLLGWGIPKVNRRPTRTPKIENGYVHYPITHIEMSQVSDLPVFNLEVEEDHSYLAEGVASHNCPPYYDLEVYSEDERDLSTAGDYADFLEAYREIIRESVALLADNRFACFVVGDLRDKKGFYRNFVSDTIAAFQDAGALLYNEGILVTAVGSLPIRIGKQFGGYRKLGKTHQNCLVFFKGDPRQIPDDFGEVSVQDLVGFADPEEEQEEIEGGAVIELDAD